MEANLLNNEVCPIELMLETISPQYVNDYIDKNFFDIIYNIEGQEKFDFINLILNNFPTRRNLKVVYREIPNISVKNKQYKQILYDTFVDALIKSTYDSIPVTDCVHYFSRIMNKKAKQKLFDFIKKIPVTDLSNKNCNKLIKRSNDAELNEILWNKIINNNPSWGDLHHLYLFTKHYKEKAEEKLKELYPERFCKEHNYQDYQDIQIKKKIGEQAYKEFAELRTITKKDFFEIKNNYEHILYETKIHPRYVVIKFSNIEIIENQSWEDFHLFGDNKGLCLKLVVKMLSSEFY